MLVDRSALVAADAVRESLKWLRRRAGHRRPPVVADRVEVCFTERPELALVEGRLYPDAGDVALLLLDEWDDTVLGPGHALLDGWFVAKVFDVDRRGRARGVVVLDTAVPLRGGAHVMFREAGVRWGRTGCTVTPDGPPTEYLRQAVALGGGLAGDLRDCFPRR